MEILEFFEWVKSTQRIEMSEYMLERVHGKPCIVIPLNDIIPSVPARVDATLTVTVRTSKKELIEAFVHPKELEQEKQLPALVFQWTPLS